LYIIHPLREYPIECRDGSRFGVKQLETVIITDHSYLPQEIE
jgi:hypothetical protein